MTSHALAYEPRDAFKPFHQRKYRWASLLCHRRAGKTVATINELIIRALYTKKTNARYAYIAPFYRQAKDVAWLYLQEATKPFANRIRISELRVELPNGAWITLYGADNPDALRGLYFDGVVLDEYGDCRPSLWGQVVLPTLADRKGWAVFIGTPKGKNHFYHIHQTAQADPNWFALTLKASESGIIDADELNQMRLNMDPEDFEQEMECSFVAAIKGTYYADMIGHMERSGRIGNHPYDPALPVKMAADLGRTDNCAIWFWQEHPTGVVFIDYLENQGKDLDFYIKALNEKGYRYEEFWLPHDAVAKTLATKRSTVEQLLDANFPCRLTPRLSRQHGIDAVRKMLPNCRVNGTTCFAGVEALRAYSRQFNEITKSFSEAPLHNWASDGADAMRYACLVVSDSVVIEKPMTATPVAGQHYNKNLETLFKDRERSGRIIRI